jgi:hypothetical protein
VRATGQVTEQRVLGWMNRISPYNDWVPQYGEIASGIAEAASRDPLWPGHGDKGALATAALLVVLAYTQSGFHPCLCGRNGTAFGLYQIEVPSRTTDATVFLVAKSASYAAVEILRQALSTPSGETVEERLVWYDGVRSPPFALMKSRTRLELANMLVSEAA